MPSRQPLQTPVGPPESESFPAATQSLPKTRRPPIIRPLLVVAAFSILIVIVVAAALYWRSGRRRKRRVSLIDGAPTAADRADDAVVAAAAKQQQPPAAPAPQRFTYDQLRRATSSFSPTNKLGQGGFGSVFRGTLPSSPVTATGGTGFKDIAVKLMDSGSLQGEREFRNELSLAATMMQAAAAADASQHVVFPIGFCSDDDEPDHHHKKTRKKKKRKQNEEEEEKDKWRIRSRRRSGGAADAATDEDDDGDSGFGFNGADGGRGRLLLLVYELMHNGSLQDALLDRKCPELAVWDRRFSVALDVAKGLEFLHTACDPPIVHGDIKPSNVLLDSNISARIADFGLARQLLTPNPNFSALTADDATSEPPQQCGKENHKKEVVAASPSDLIYPVGGEDCESTTAAETESTTTAFDEANGFTSTPTNRMTTTTATNDHGNGGAAKPDEEGFIWLAEADGTSPDTTMTAGTLEVASVSEVGGYDKLSVDSGADMLAPASRKGWRKKSSSVSGKDWWWRQDANHPGIEGRSESTGTVKDYVMQWIGSEVGKEMPKSSLITTAGGAATASHADDSKAVPAQKPERKKQQRRLEWWASLDEDRLRKKGKRRPAREWWREEFCEELANKKKRQVMAKSNGGAIGVGGGGRQWWQKDDEEYVTPLGKKHRKKKSWSRGSRTSMDWWMDGLSRDLRATGRRPSQDWASGDIPRSGGLSSTPSMRGTVCYVAPEYGGGGPLSEKCDIYSFGVLLLVIISGRRPLQVTASPMSEFERANLISWARHLAHTAKLLDLVDSSLQFVDREQALLCITIALLCLQRSPTRRPTIKEVVGMLSGDSEPPHLPLEFSPSPPCGFSFKSRRRPR